MISVVMDTSNQYLSVGLFKDGKMLDAYQKIGTKRQSEDAIPVLHSLIERHDISLRSVDEMIITKGPGSYTGVRVAMTIAKTLAAIAPVKIKTVSSLAAYAGNKKAISIIDPRSKKVFACVYDQGKPLMEEMMCTYEEALALKQQYPDFSFVGQTSLLGVDPEEADLCNNIYQLSLNVEAEEYVDALTPTYIKNVEAKKACI